MLRRVLYILPIIFLAACQSGNKENNMGADGTNNNRMGGGVTSRNTPNIPAGSQEDLAINIGDRVFFGYDGANLNPESQATLVKQAQWLNNYPNLEVVIEGHCDERGTREYNLALGERRANSVRNFLISLGVSDSRLTTVSYGKERPEILGSTPDSWQQNRRSVTVIK